MIDPKASLEEVAAKDLERSPGARAEGSVFDAQRQSDAREARPVDHRYLGYDARRQSPA